MCKKQKLQRDVQKNQCYQLHEHWLQLPTLNQSYKRKTILSAMKNVLFGSLYSLFPVSKVLDGHGPEPADGAGSLVKIK